jgi:glucose-6-phosphate dehydrogenase assembly protein OpcA
VAVELARRKAGYRPGDTDLAWTRLTPWRAVLAAILDQPVGPINSATVHAEASNASSVLMVTWLHRALKVPVDLQVSDGPGITQVRLATAAGDITVNRPDGSTAILSRPGMPDSRVSLRRRELADLLAEELRRLDPDEVYGDVIRHTGLV